MIDKKTKIPIYKHADIAADADLGSSNFIDGLSVGIGVSFPENDLLRKDFRSDFITILLITNGQVTVGANLQKYCIGVNNVFIAAPHMVKQLINVQKETTCNVVSFTANFLSKIGMLDNLPEKLDYVTSQFEPYWELDTENAILLTDLMEAVKKRYDDYNTHQFGKELLYHTFNIFLLEMSALSRSFGKQSKAGLPIKETLVMNFVNLVQKNFTQEREVKEYAKQLNVTAKYLTETVKEISGKSAGEIVDDFVIMEAKLMLANQSMSIGEIASLLSFSDQSFFGKYFKRLTNLSPKEYRNNLQ